MVINGERVPFSGEKNILSVVRKAGIDLPTLCYYSELSVYGSCRMCMVEDQRGNIITACSTPPKNGMEIKTNTPRLKKYRKNILRLYLASHNRECTTCPRNTTCKLQDLAIRFGIEEIKFDKTDKAWKDEYKIDNSSPSITRDPNKCIQCGDCVRMCNETQNVGAIDFALRGYELKVCPAFDMPLAETECVNCGQCAAVCPTGAVTIKNDVPSVWKAIYDDKKRVVAQIAPAVRVALGEEFGISKGENVMPLIVAAMRKIGFDEIYDTSFSADLTVIEETNEFLGKLESGAKLPLFTSCCPAWVSYVEEKHPELMPQVSTCKSPQQMFGSVIKAYAKDKYQDDEKETIVVSVMPCTAKKAEAGRAEFVTEGSKDVDIVLTTKGLADMIYESGIVFKELEPEALDMPFGMYSGAGLIFGVTGGVTEAVIRKVIKDKSHASINNVKFCGARGMEGIKEFDLPLEDGETVLKIAVVSGLGNAEQLIRKMEAGEAFYHFIEVMACPGGCIGGAGQPFGLRNTKRLRAESIYASDKQTQLRHADENPVIPDLYNTLLKDRTHELLHVHYHK
ncbi:ferredoxin [Anoxybacterium hadale]|uniref:Ferredoxin n=2 Tax=Anoxybacterium hadale TaxID=3408580 RepID=A0ACD1AHM1_9FIRM|nr:ferredoxin [Clostridiales bacterium]